MAQATYVDGFVLAIPKKNIAKYKKMAREAAKVWKKYGAIDYKECIADDVKSQSGALSFPGMTKVKPDEVVWFSYVTYKNRKHRDAVNKKVMAYFEKKYSEKDMADMPFDMKRMAYGGFSVAVSA